MSAETVEIDDGELIRRSVHDPEQFAALFDRYAQQIHLYAARRLGTQAADDIVAETFLAAFRRRGTYDTSFALARPWLYGIATTLIARHRRQEERLLRALSRTGVDPLPEALDDTVARRVAAQGRERELAGALASLPRGHRDVLLLVAWEDMSYEEVARALDISVGTVRSRLHRARKKARNVLGDEEL
ncbi:RNA polymerase sigma factor [Nonomuraea basaltis]|uniref:RNA polymerase sigma factor n=1 Tax=Nonomuraea basaltis TaxID=2495887 RepID=UPI00110C4619|nr:RNA polymerase sigma factor [Nonomuraea basaltis]TMR93941.1 RNA polymerase sigma factor [Nonomuraea basaltis]